MSNSNSNSNSDTTTPATPPESVNHISSVRAMLLATMADLRNPDKPMEIDRALAVSTVAQTVINSAKVEVEYLQKTGQISAPFLEVPPDAPYLTGMVTLPSGAKLASHKHRLQG